MGYDSSDDRIPVGKIFGFFLLVIVVCLGLTWLATGNDFFLYKYFAPKQAQVQRHVYEQTPSYVKGMVQDLQDKQFQYVQADAAHKAGLADLILHEAAGFDLNDPDVPADLREFIQKLKDDRAGR